MSSIRLRKITPSTSSSPTKLDTVSSVSSDSTFLQSPDPEPDYTVATPSPLYFRTLLVSNASCKNLTLSLPALPGTSEASQPLFYVTNSTFKPSLSSVTLSSLSKKGPVLGIFRVNPWGPINIVGLGNPAPDFNSQSIEFGDREDDWQDVEGELGDGGVDGGMGLRGMVWERLTKTSKWTHSIYEFEYKGRRYTWQRTVARIFLGDQPDLELRENVESTSGRESPVLAVYKGCQGFFTKARGQFWLRKTVDEEDREEKAWNDWEIMVLLTALGIIEMARRVARARRKY